MSKVIDKESIEREPLTPDQVWVRIDRDELRIHVEIPFWLLAHLRAMSKVYAKTSELYGEYLKSYQEGFEPDVMVNWLAEHQEFTDKDELQNLLAKQL